MHTLSHQLLRYRTYIAIFLAVFTGALLLSATAFAANGGILKEDAAELLPLARWIDGAGTFHDRVGFSVNNAGEWIGAKQRSSVVGTIMGLTNFFWDTALSLLTQALSLDMLKGIAKTIDSTAKSLGKAVMGRKGAIGLLVLTVIAFLAWTIWKSRTLGMKSIFTTLAPRVIAISLLSLMVFAPAPRTENQTREFAPFSAPWYIEVGNKASNAIAMPILEVSGLVSADNTSETSAFSEDKGGVDGLSCNRYVKQLRKAYIGEVKDFGKRPDAQAALVLSNLWEGSGMQVWKQIQLGETDTEGYADRSYCRLLDGMSNTPALGKSGSAAQTFRAMDGTKTTSQFSKYFDDVKKGVGYKDRNKVPEIMQGYRGSVIQDKSTVTWAACKVDSSGNWKADLALAKTEDQDKANEACKKYFSSRGGEMDKDIGEEFNWNKGIDRGRSPEAVIFVDSLQGRNTTDATVGAVAYLVSSIAVGVSFIMMALAILISKIAMVGFASFLALILIGSLFPGQDTTKKLGGAAKTFIGYAFISAFAVGILALVVLLTNVIVTLMKGFIDPGSTFSILLVGFAPVLSIYILNTVFKKMGIPSPMSVKGAMSWGESAGGLGKAVVGGAVAGGIGGSLMNRAGRQAARTASEVGKNALGNRIGNGPARRGQSRHGMKPIGEETKGATDKTAADATKAAAGIVPTSELSPEERKKLRDEFNADQNDAKLGGLAAMRAQRADAKHRADDAARAKMADFDLRSPDASRGQRWLASQSATISSQWDRAKNMYYGAGAKATIMRDKMVDFSPKEAGRTAFQKAKIAAPEIAQKAKGKVSSAASRSKNAVREGAKYAVKHPVSAAGNTMRKGAKYAAIAGGVGVAAGVMPVAVPVAAALAANKAHQGVVGRWEDQDAKFEEWRQARYAQEQEEKAKESGSEHKEKAVPEPEKKTEYRPEPDHYQDSSGSQM